MVREPAWMVTGGIRESPSRKVTWRMVRPRASAATWVMDVAVPGPMSLVADCNRAVPSAPSLTGTWASPRWVS